MPTEIIIFCCFCWSLLYSAILRSRADSLRSHECWHSPSEWLLHSDRQRWEPFYSFINCKGQSPRQCPRATTLDVKGVPKQETEPTSSAYQTKAFLLGQSGWLVEQRPGFELFIFSSSTRCRKPGFEKAYFLRSKSSRRRQVAFSILASIITYLEISVPAGLVILSGEDSASEKLHGLSV